MNWPNEKSVKEFSDCFDKAIKQLEEVKKNGHSSEFYNSIIDGAIASFRLMIIIERDKLDMFPPIINGEK